MTSKTIEVYVELLEEGTDTWRATNAIDLGNGTCQLLPTDNYDPEDEIWAFLPGTVIAFKEVYSQYLKRNIYVVGNNRS